MFVSKTDEDRKSELLPWAIEKMYMERMSWRDVLLLQPWHRRILLVQMKGKIDKIMKQYAEIMSSTQ